MPAPNLDHQSFEDIPRRERKPRGQLRYKYISEKREPNGKIRLYFRRPNGGRRTLLPGRPGSPQFMKAYYDALAGLEPAAKKKAQKVLDRIDEAQTRPEPLIGIYLLFDNGELVYIGSSSNLPDRVAAHRKNGRPFDRVIYVPTKLSECGEVEQFLIKAFVPTQNRTHNIKHRWLSFEQALALTWQDQTEHPLSSPSSCNRGGEMSQAHPILESSAIAKPLKTVRSSLERRVACLAYNLEQLAERLDMIEAAKPREDR